MSFSPVGYPDDPSSRYALILEQVDALTDSADLPNSILATTAALLWQGLPNINWCGFNLIHRDMLLLGPFCGLPACVRIPLGQGVCGTAASADAIQRVLNVHEFPGHIACDSASNSEIVIPLHWRGRVVGVLDIDSPLIARFDEIDEANLLQLTRLIETRCDFSNTAYHL